MLLEIPGGLLDPPGGVWEARGGVSDDSWRLLGSSRFLQTPPFSERISMHVQISKGALERSERLVETSGTLLDAS